MKRRDFLYGMAMAAAALPCRHVFGAGNRKPAVALIGRGVQGRRLLHEFLGQDVVVRAVCDVDKDRCADALKVVRDYYASRPELGIAPDACRAVADFRDIMSDPGIDQVAIATPDHWHAYMTIEALKHGKDVYCEKPLTYNIAEAKAVMAAAKKYGRIVQTGALQRSAVEFRTAAMLCRNGCIGKIASVDVCFGGPSRPHRAFFDPANSAAEGAPNPNVDFDMWLGPAPATPYSDQLSPRGVHETYPMFWRFDDWFGAGAVGDWGAHHLDIAQWGLDLDASGPVKVVASTAPRSSDPLDGGRRPSGVQLVCADGTTITHGAPGEWAVVFHGAGGKVAVDRGKFGLWDEKGKVIADSTHDKSMLAAVMKATKAFKLKKAKVQLYKSLSHVADFCACCQSRQQPSTPAETGARAAILCHLCNLSYVRDAGFDWDPVANAFANGTGDSAWLSRADARPAWKV